MFLPRVLQKKATTSPQRPNPALPTLTEVQERERLANQSDKQVEVKVIVESGDVKAPLPDPAHVESTEGSEGENDVISEVVKACSAEQRRARKGEPICVICGLYGEYICDETDLDVCSRQCKIEHLVREAAGDTQRYLYGYSECEEVAEAGEERMREIRERRGIRVQGDEVPKPLWQFEQARFPAVLQLNITAQGYFDPTPIQMQAVSVILMGRDLLASSPTGTGKTAAFLIPLIALISTQANLNLNLNAGPFGMVLAPTRELAIQIEEQAKGLMKGMPSMRTALVVGGFPLANQVHRLKKGVELVVATPGRLIEVMEKHAADVSFRSVRLLVVDEVDEMLALGFEAQVRKILEGLASRIQVLLFSATIPNPTEKLAASILRNPVRVQVGAPRELPVTVKHTFLWVEEASKKKKLFEVMSSQRHFRPPAVVFVESKAGAELLASAITTKTNVRAVSLHSNKSQAERLESLDAFLRGDIPVMVATGILARGLDTLIVQQVILFDFPRNVEDYVHQTGRAGRDSHGSAMSFINARSQHLFYYLNQLLQSLKPTQLSPLPPELANSPFIRKKPTTRRGGGSRHRGEEGSKPRGKKRQFSSGDDAGLDEDDKRLLAELKRHKKVV